MSQPNAPKWLLLIAVPMLAVSAAAVVLTMLGLFERNPFWPRQDDMTMAEAAALRDPGSVAWMIRLGVDPNVRMRVRPGVFDDREHQLTPGEAAVTADRIEVLATLIVHGARVDAAVVERWYCLARSIDADESLEYLRSRYPDWTNGSCASGSSE